MTGLTVAYAPTAHPREIADLLSDRRTWESRPPAWAVAARAAVEAGRLGTRLIRALGGH